MLVCVCCMLYPVSCILHPVSCLLWPSVGLRIGGPKAPRLPSTGRVLRILPAPGNPQKTPINDTPICHPQSTQGDPKVSIVELLAPKMTPKWSQRSTLFVTGRQSENRPPAAARTLLSTSQNRWKKRIWFRVTARALHVRLLKPAGIQKTPTVPKMNSKVTPK